MLTTLLLTELISPTCYITAWCSHTPIQEETLLLYPSLVNSIHHLSFFFFNILLC